MPIPNIQGPQTREYTLSKSKIDEKARTVELSFSSETPVPRFYGLEILSHSRGAADLSRLNSGAALLLDHDRSKQIGVVESANIAGGKGRAVVRFSKSTLGEEVFQDVKDGIRTLVSFSYEVGKVEPAPKVNGEEAFRVLQWKPLEVSIVSIPADPTVGVGRSYPKGTMNTVTDDPQLITRGETQDEYESSILRIARMANCEAEGRRAIVAGTPLEQFRKAALAKMPAAKPLGEWEAPERHTETRSVSDGLWNAENCIGMSENEIRSYSILSALNSVANTGRVEGLVAEATRACEKHYRRAAPGNGFIVPWDVLQYQKRTMTAGSNTAGGFLVATELHNESFIDKLRNRAVISSMGARILSGLRGDIAVPKTTGDVTAYWLSETATVSDSDMTLGQVVLTPNRVAATNKFSKQLAIQTGQDVETLVRDNIAKQIALSWDLKAIAGSGSSGEPMGILNSTGLSTAVTFGAAATWAKVVEFETNLAASNADAGNIGWIVSPATRGKWKTAVKVAGQAVFLWENDLVNGYKAFATNQIPSGDKAIFGNFADLLIGIWGGGLDVVVDPYSLATSNQIRVTSQMHCDIALARPTSFVISTDSAAQ